MAKVPHLTGTDGDTLAAGTTTYHVPYIHGLGIHSVGVEANSEARIRASQTRSGLRCYLSANATTGASTFRSRKNATNGGQGSTDNIGAGQTGYFEFSGSDVLSSGDRYAWQWIVGAGGAITFGYYGDDLAAGADVVSTLGCIQGGNSTNSATRFSGPGRANAYQATESPQQLKVAIPVTVEFFRLWSTGNGRGTDSTMRSRIDAANGAQSFVIPANTAGEFEDLTNSDSVSVDSLVGFSLTTGGGGGFLNAGPNSANFRHASAAILTAGCPNNTAITQNAGLTRYGHMIGRVKFSATSETAAIRQRFKEAHTQKLFRINVTANNINTGTSTLKIYKNGTVQSVVINIAAGATGWFEDLTNTISIAVDDECSFELVTSGSTGSLSIQIVPWVMDFAAGSVGLIDSDDVTSYLHNQVSKLEPNVMIVTGKAA